MQRFILSLLVCLVWGCLACLAYGHYYQWRALPGDERTVKVKLHKDGHWYPASEKGWEWYGRLDGGKPSRPVSIDDPSTWPDRVF